MIKEDFFKKKFSVGLCLNEPLAAIDSFMKRNKDRLNSVYFSLPLGMRFFSRESLADEYDNNEEKLFTVLDMLASHGIRREMAINTWDLSDKELDSAIRYCREHNICPEEIVCLREYGEILSKAFPDAEIKYSVNNPEADGSGITKYFHTLVAGKGLLRDMNARHSFIEKGYQMTLLLNNGCLAICNTPCDTIRCHRYFDHAINKYGLDRVYAECSFFPSELRTLILCDKYSDRYKYKISNRPLGLQYTQQVLDAYLSMEDNYEDMQADYRKMALFCTAHPLAVKLRQVDTDQVRMLKEQWMTELLHDNNR